MGWILLILFSIILVMLVIMTYRLRSVISTGENEKGKAGSLQIQNWMYAALIFTTIAILASIWFIVRGGPYEGHLMEWLNIVMRVMHVTFGIAWIGASFYFVFLENALNRKEGIRDELAGDL